MMIDRRHILTLNANNGQATVILKPNRKYLLVED